MDNLGLLKRVYGQFLEVPEIRVTDDGGFEVGLLFIYPELGVWVVDMAVPPTGDPVRVCECGYFWEACLHSVVTWCSVRSREILDTFPD